jgi:predicted nucleic acid-binding protein
MLVSLDASVLVAAARSPSGGSSLVLEVCRGRRFRAALSTKVLLEAKVNIAEKFGETELLRFYRELAASTRKWWLLHRKNNWNNLLL